MTLMNDVRLSLLFHVYFISFENFSYYIFVGSLTLGWEAGDNDDCKLGALVPEVALPDVS